MKIRSLELLKVPPRWLFLRVETQSGIVGWGEPIVEGKADTVAACVRELGEQIIGRSAGDIEDIWQTLYRGGFYRGGPVLTSALSGIEQALWDIKGKYHGLPVYAFLGGNVRERMPVYRAIGGEGPDAVAAAAKEALAQGYRTVKMNGTEAIKWLDSHRRVDEVIERVSAVREAVGSALDVAMDFHGRVHKPMAKLLLRKLVPFDLLFVEEPVLCENEEAFLELARGCSIPLATGERNYTRWGFKRMLVQGGVDILQPDVSHAGGILETRKIAAMAEAFDAAIAPHCPLGPIALAACLQVDFCSPNAILQEQSLNIHLGGKSELLRYLADPTAFGYRDGHVALPTQPGLGIALDEAYVRQLAQTGHDWHNPLWRDEDGCVTEW